MNKVSNTEGWRVQLKVETFLVSVAILLALLNLFASDLSLSEFFKHITFSISLICIITFVLPDLKKLGKTREK